MRTPSLNSPVELITSNAPPEGASASEWPLILAVIGAILFSLVTLHLWMRTRGDGDAEEAAFRELAARLRLSRDQKRLVRELAEVHPNASPSAVLLSPNALLEGAKRLSELTGDRRAEVAGLLTTLGVGSSAPDAPASERERLELIA